MDRLKQSTPLTRKPIYASSKPLSEADQASAAATVAAKNAEDGQIKEAQKKEFEDLKKSWGLPPVANALARFRSVLVELFLRSYSSLLLTVRFCRLHAAQAVAL